MATGLQKNFSVIIPCYNNASSIPLVIQALFSQVIVPGWQVAIIVVDDGSNDQTVSILKKITASPTPWPVKILRQQHRGAAAARNLGIAAANTELILLLGSDIILRPAALAAHFQYHERFADSHYAALGFVKWDPRLRPSPLMEYLEHGGPQNDYDSLLNGRAAPAEHFFYGSHLSLKKSFLPPRPFNEDFTSYGWEDLELGRRLSEKGLVLHPLPQAIGLHHHFYSPNGFFRRQAAVGANLVAYQRLHPTASLLPPRSAAKKFIHRLLPFTGLLGGLKLAVRLTAHRFSLPWLYQLTASAIFWQGVNSKISIKPK